LGPAAPGTHAALQLACSQAADRGLAPGLMTQHQTTVAPSDSESNSCGWFSRLGRSGNSSTR
jgi:hypothetical protein